MTQLIIYGIIFLIAMIPLMVSAQTNPLPDFRIDSVIQKSGSTILRFVQNNWYTTYVSGDSLVTRNWGNEKRGLVSPLDLPVSSAVQTALNLKTSNSDTATMLSPYLRAAAVTAGFIATVLGYTAANAATLNNYKLITDSGRGISNYVTGYDLNKVRDSVQTNIPTNNNQLSNGAGYLTSASISGKLNISDTAAMLTNYLRSNGSAANLTNFPTFNQNTTGSAASLTTGRTIGIATGDVTSAGSSFNGTANNTNAYTLATVNGNVGSFGSTTQVGSFTVNGKGLVTAASNVSIAYPGATSFTGYGTGTAYTLTTSAAKITFGTTSPTITITSPGTYLIVSNVTLDYVGLTTLSVAAANFKVRRSNNTAADIANTSQAFNIPILTLSTQTGGDADIPAFIYTTANSNDVLELWGQRGGLSVGSIQITNGYMVAIKIN